MEKYIIALKSVIAAGGGSISYLLGGLDQLLTTMIVVMVLDFITGILKAVVTKELSSNIGRVGISKKVLSLVVVALAFVIEDLMGHAMPLREIAIMFFIANEGISLLENAAVIGLPIPEKLKDALLQLHEEKKK